MSKRVFGIEDYQRARTETLKLLQEIAARRETISYSEFGLLYSDPIHHRNPMLYELLRDVCHEERLAGRPNLCALVVRKSDGMPGKGFFDYSGWDGEDVGEPRVFWEQSVQACWDYYALGEQSD
jgi:hypothetical protein